MSGMKFRLQCAGCGATFFAPDRKTRYCPKCVKKRASKTGAVEAKREESKPPERRFAPKPDRGSKDQPKPAKEAAPRPAKEAAPRPAKTVVLTPELREQVERLYQSEKAGNESSIDEIIARISDQVWVSRKAVKHVINKLIQPDVSITPEMRERIIEIYRGYVERSERPAQGRRRAIAEKMGVPLRQVMKIVYDWSQSQYDQSPTPELSREQRFEIEKVYWDEIEKKRYRYSELPAKIAERLGFVNAYQVSRWLDTLHDDQRRFDKIADPEPEFEQQILEAYRRYLAAPKPPEQGLHSSIATQIGGISGRQVHKALQRYRYEQRDKYPLK